MLRTFFTFLNGQNLLRALIFVLWLGFTQIGILVAQTATNGTTDNPAPLSINNNTNVVEGMSTPTNAIEVSQPAANAPIAPAPVTAPASTPSLTSSEIRAESDGSSGSSRLSGWLVLAPLLTLASIGGFLLYQCGQSRAKNCGHTSTLLLVGLVFGLIGYWMGGFAVQMGGVGDAHAALVQSVLPSEKSTLDHELGFRFLGHYWSYMGSSGFFLITDETSRNATAALFLSQAVLLAIAVAAALGAALERGRLLAMAITAFLIGALIYPLFANWVWGGGWLAEMGREFGLGHGFVDLAGAGVVHETAGTLALVIAMALGPRYGKFGRNKSINSIPGHNMPFLLLGAMILLISWTATNAFAYSNSGLAAVNALLAAAGGALISFLIAAGQKQAPQPALLCRGLLGGIISIFACSALIDPWAAFVIGILAGLIIQFTIHFVEERGIDDPMGAISVHGAGGAWGVLAAGLFANGTAGKGINGIDGPVRGLLLTGDWHQLAAQAIGGITCFVVVFILGYACLSLIQKILGNRVELADEVHGLDWTQTGAFGYQGDIDSEEISRGKGDRESEPVK